MTLAAVVNILLDPLLIFGLGPIPALGLKGAAIASVISRIGTLAASLAFLHFREHLLLFRIPSFRTTIESWRRLLSIGFPAIATNLVSPLSVGLITGLMARYGAEAVAGFGLASRIEAVALIVPLAISASIGPFVGQNWGAQQYDRVRQSLQLSFGFCLSWGGIVAISLGATAPKLVTLFDSDPSVVTGAVTYLTLVPISYGALGIFFAISSALNALGKPLSALILSLSRLLLIYVPLAYLGSHLFGISGIFGAACISNAIVGLSAWLWHSRWSANLPKIDTLEQLSPLPRIAAQEST